jgi:hypothetical protein
MFENTVSRFCYTSPMEKQPQRASGRPMRPFNDRWILRDAGGFEDEYMQSWQMLDDYGRPTNVFVLSSYIPPSSDSAEEAWQISVSCMWRRANDDEVKVILEDFGCQGFGELVARRDLVRHFWWPRHEGDRVLLQ